MDKLERGDLLSLENYALERIEFRARVMAHKKQRTAHLGGHLTLIFEDRLSIQYQVQEMLRIERIFERFYTDRPAGEAFGQNSGLGLSISRQIVEAHGGTLTAENIPGTKPGEIRGARFLVALPAEG